MLKKPKKPILRKKTVKQQIEETLKNQNLEGLFVKLPREQIVDVSRKRKEYSVILNKSKLKRYKKTLKKKPEKYKLFDKKIHIHNHFVSVGKKPVIPSINDIMSSFYYQYIPTGTVKSAIYFIETRPNLRYSNKVVGRFYYRLDFRKLTNVQKENIEKFVSLYSPIKKYKPSFIRDYFKEVYKDYPAYEKKLVNLRKSKDTFYERKQINLLNIVSQQYFIENVEKILADLGFKFRMSYSKSYKFNKKSGELVLKN